MFLKVVLNFKLCQTDLILTNNTKYTKFILDPEKRNIYRTYQHYVYIQTLIPGKSQNMN